MGKSSPKCNTRALWRCWVNTRDPFMKKVQRSLAWVIHTTARSIRSSAPQGQVIWTQFFSDSAAHKAHLYEGCVHSGPLECACLGGTRVDLRYDRTGQYIFSPCTLEHVLSSTSVFDFWFPGHWVQSVWFSIQKKGPQITWWLHNVESWRLQTHAKPKMWFMHVHVKCRFCNKFYPYKSRLSVFEWFCN